MDRYKKGITPHRKTIQTEKEQKRNREKRRPSSKTNRLQRQKGDFGRANKALDLLYKEKGARSYPHQRNKACKACELYTQPRLYETAADPVSRT